MPTIKIKKTKLLLAMMFAVTHLNIYAQTAGSLDSSFGINGKVVTPISQHQGVVSVAIQTDGKILTGVSQGGYPGFVIRYNYDGSIDSSFGTAGIAYLSGGKFPHIAIQSDGKICAATSWYNYLNLSDDYKVTRLNTNGSIDSSFGIAGSVTTDINSETNRVTSIVIQQDDKILVTGPSYLSSLTVRYNPDGSLDTSFGSGGIVYTTLSTTFWSSINFLAVQPDGKIVGAGYYSVSWGDGAFAVVRFNNDGSLDSTFGTGGKVFTSIITDDLNFASAVTIQSDGKIVVAGHCHTPQGVDIGLVRYDQDGTLDTTFGTGGMVLTDIYGFGDAANSILVQSDGRIIVAGYSNIGQLTNSYFILVCYNTDGSLDTSFGTSGIVTTSFGSIYDRASCAALQADGKIVLAGETNSGQFNEIALARYLSTLNVGIIDPELPGIHNHVYPNPIANGSLTVEYELLREETITITLWDITGRQIITFIQNEKRTSGKQKEVLTIPQNLAGGTYLLQIKTHKSTTSIKIVIK